MARWCRDENVNENFKWMIIRRDAAENMCNVVKDLNHLLLTVSDFEFCLEFKERKMAVE